MSDLELSSPQNPLTWLNKGAGMSRTAIPQHQGTPKNRYHATIVCLMKNK
jgi:hypothetical protein